MESFDPASVVAVVCPVWVDLLGEVPPPLPLTGFPLRLIFCPAVFLPLLRVYACGFLCGNLHFFADGRDFFVTGVRGYNLLCPWIYGGLRFPPFLASQGGF